MSWECKIQDIIVKFLKNCILECNLILRCVITISVGQTMSVQGVVKQICKHSPLTL